jgi:diaminopimelate decarboxylase
MNHFEIRAGSLFAEDVPLESIAAEYGTPTFVYSRAALVSAHAGYTAALAGRDAMLCYAVKSNSNLAIMNVFARLGTGFDIVSGGELSRVLAAGGDPGKVVFSGVGKTRDEMRAALIHGIYCFNVESEAELFRLAEVAGSLGKRAPIALRVNPDVDPKTHPYISTGLKCNKFGVPITGAQALYRAAAELPQLEIRGIACHIGSQLLDPAPVAEAAAKVVALAEALNRDGIELRHLDLGGGLGIRYDDEDVPSTQHYLAPLLEVLAGRKERLLLEPGRSLVGNAGVLLSRVEYLKRGEDRNFAIIDAAMNDLARPALYDAWHRIAEVKPRDRVERYDVVGPVCESGDFLGRARDLAIEESDLVAIFSAGAYGMTMSSNYNTRPRAAEVMVDGAACHLIRERERVEDLYAGERLLP